MKAEKDAETVSASIGLDWSSRSTPAQLGRLVLPALLASLLFYMDFHAPDHMIFGLPFLMVVILAQNLGGGSAAALSAAVTAGLVLLNPFLTEAPIRMDPAWMVFVGRGSVVAAIGMTVLFLRQRDAARHDLREQMGAIENSTSSRGDQLRLVNAQLHREIAERRRAELRSGYLASIVESSADAIIGQSRDGTIVSWNAGAARMYGFTRADMIDAPSSCLVPPEEEEQLMALLKRVSQGERVDEMESSRLRADGTKFDVSASFSPIIDDKGEILGVSIIERDITRRMHAEEALQSLNTELEAKVRERTEDLEAAVGELETFSFSVSHDLRAPLRAVRGMAQALAGDAAPRLLESEREMVERIQVGTERMDRIIEDLLLLSRAGNDQVERQVVNLGEIAASVIEELRAASPQRVVEWSIGDGLLAWGDPGLLRLVVQNLLGNAFKYTEKKERARISIGVDARGADAVTYFVRDDGVGFDSDSVGKMFQPFSRLHRSEGFEGHGIGLATVDRIVRRHGGVISAQSCEGEGATFRFRLPVPKRTRVGAEDEFLAAEAACA